MATARIKKGMIIQITKIVYAWSSAEINHAPIIGGFR